MTPFKALYEHDLHTLLYLMDESYLNEKVNCQLRERNLIFYEFKANLLKA